MKRILSILICFIILISSVNVPLAAEENHISALHVEGKYLYNEQGEKVRLMGGNIPDTQWSTGLEGNADERVSMLLDQWNGNCVRLCVSSKFWFGQEWYQNNDSTNYKNFINYLIDEITSRGKYVILNLHEFYAVIERNKDFWLEASQVYGNNPGVLFGILNEPHDTSWDIWKNGGYITKDDGYGNEISERVYGMQEMVDMIRKTGANNICVVGGLDWAYEYSGLADGYDGLEHGYTIEDTKGNGIIYDTHIYPMKPEYNPPEKALANVIEKAPVLVGETGHWGERLFDWYDNYLCEYPYIWMNTMQDFIDRNELNYTYWSFHRGASPSMVLDLKSYEPTKYSGWYQKYFLLENPDTRPAESERMYQDKSPLYTWKKIYDFDDNDLKFNVYGDEVQTEKTVNGLDGNGQFVNFDIKGGNKWKSAAIADFPATDDLSGANYMSFRIKGDKDIRNIGIGFELKDGRQFTASMPMDLHDNWKNYVLPLAVFKGDYGLFDTTMIKSIMFTSLDDGAGSFTLDNITVAGFPYKESTHSIASDMNEKEILSWKSWEDFESINDDSFAVTDGNKGIVSHNSAKINYNCPKGSYGGQARITIPDNWDLTDKNYISFWARGDGNYQKFTLRFEEINGTNKNEQHSNFKKREMERFCTSFEVNSKEWKKYTIRISDLGMSDILHLNKLKYISLFNMILESKGTLEIDGLSFTADNNDEKLEEHYSYHGEVTASKPIGEVKTKYPQNEVLQIPKTFVVTAGEESYISVHLMNKTDNPVTGYLKISGLPIEGVENTKYNVYAHDISYPKYPWREYSLSNFKFTIPKDKAGEYEITVSDADENGIVKPYTYKLIVKSAE